MALPIVEAVSFQKYMTSGRTKPCLMHCEAFDGDVLQEYVVKLKAGPESNGYTSMAFEIIGSGLATFLGVSVPEPALIKISPEFVRCITDPELKARLDASVGLNFGSSFLNGGYTSWPTGQKLSDDLLISALRLFLFDALIQNPDRTAIKPNVLVRSDDIYAIDHELGFSFARSILPLPTPWIVAGEPWLQKHAFFSGLKGKDLNFDTFGDKLEMLDSTVLDTIYQDIPDDWGFPYERKVKEHILVVCEHKAEFISDLRRMLA